ncbi:indole-3-glycerol phosphate synthase TrpC [Desulfitobacterium metallireducens]|uniref:indole-3-glycerol-phosphate synthase n=1 Tax=Desulfitobacterium metallireducens DSM 15288 TaxID=871968 RepID=W0EB05_9FIRM|nr:indole-3-glycerol phosphate synthase TrpC [Desulfitobacterium metallireducens]AHF07952.1 indole-3-glycerol phosphate synthase [Desulfitobacterium metallireducens DSM 15288]
MNILEKILVEKSKRLDQLQEAVPFSRLVTQYEDAQTKSKKENDSSKTGFDKPIFTQNTFQVIAEIKRASPSKGKIPWALSLEDLLKQYESGGASLISVLTEEDFFLGSNTLFQTVRQLTLLPLLRKDFIFTKYQVYESALLGANVILLITSILDQQKLHALIILAEQLGLIPLVECRDEEEIAKALAAGATLLGINNRDLRTFEINLNRTAELSQLIPKDCFLVSESGILEPKDAALVSHFGADAILVGESCVRSNHPGEHIRALLEAGQEQKLLSSAKTKRRDIL